MKIAWDTVSQSMTGALVNAALKSACRFCVVWRIGGQKSHPEFHRVRGDCRTYKPDFCSDAMLKYSGGIMEVGPIETASIICGMLHFTLEPTRLHA
ncbi:hypothetical protein [Pararhizobium sp.]|uniref:hypothetical protein n=1 Tax=Pararhizobium sp. TaxID=1977563 RepID=UPI003D123CF2